jgi:cytochrome c oxidase subunit II
MTTHALSIGSALDPSGTGASQITDLWWVMFWLSLIPIVIVGAIVVAILLRRRRDSPGATHPPAETSVSERSDRLIILLGGVVLPILLLIPVAVVAVGTASERVTADDETFEIGVTGHQFWWDLEYPSPGSNRLDDGETFRTANEIHIPAGRPVEFRLESEDVNHSLWVPELDGKTDLIPGRTNRLAIQADSPGVYQGLCAEFCGLGHAKMRFKVIAHEEEEFEEWLERESAPADLEVDAESLAEFGDSCAVCHDVRGLFEERTFRSSFGPDLTHFASRRTLGADIISNTPQGLARWIADPQGVKPGNRMPHLGLEGDELNLMVELLGRLE